MAFFHACITSLDIENSLSVFNCRVAGNVENFDILGSMEFTRKLSGAKVILVKPMRSFGLRACSVGRAGSRGLYSHRKGVYTRL
jgi:hypothetical protein